MGQRWNHEKTFARTSGRRQPNSSRLNSAAQSLALSRHCFKVSRSRQGHGLVLQRLSVDGDAIGSSSFVLAAVTPADRTFFVVEDGEPVLQLAIDLLGNFRHAVFLDQRKDAALIGASRGWNFITTRSVGLPFSSGAMSSV